MICPKCGAEYRRGFTTCSDCQVLLVNEGAEAAERQPKAWSTWSTRAQESAGQRTKEAGEAEESDPSEIAAANGDANDEQEDFADRSNGTVGDPNTDPFCSFWKGADLRVCTEICTVLDEADIPHKTIRRQDHLFNLINQAPYEIGVPASLYQRAENAIREAFGTEEEGEGAVKLLPPPEEDARAKTLRGVWVGDNAADCASLCKELKNAEIPYRVDEQKEILTGGKTLDRYQIGVSEKDFSRAVEITGGFHPDALNYMDDDEEISGEVSFDSHDEGDPGSEWVAGNQRKQRGEFDPEDATSLAWEGDVESWRGAIEMCLKEFDIPMRWETENGTERVYVLREDESRAKGIVQEVVTGEPSDGED